MSALSIESIIFPENLPASSDSHFISDQLHPGEKTGSSPAGRDFLESPVSGSPVLENSVLVLGNFDGLHKGHKRVISEARQLAETEKLPLAVGIFAPHPRRYFLPDQAPFMLMSSRLMAQALRAGSVAAFYKIRFNQALASMGDRDFVFEVLKYRLRVRWVVVGEDFQFGKDRCGNTYRLEKFSKLAGFRVKTVQTVGINKQKYSSTAIREALKTGACDKAAKSLGHFWTVDGQVEKGDQRGRILGFPTANLRLKDYLEPRFGVYIVRARIEGEKVWRPAIANIGKRPTLGGKDVFLEVHFLQYNCEIYGKVLEVAFLDFIREEQSFEGLEALKAQIARDVEVARKFHTESLPVFPGFLPLSFGSSHQEKS